MDQVYRMRGSARAGSRHKAIKERGGRSRIVKQAFLCLALFAFCLYAKFSSAPSFASVRQTIQLMLETQTDFAAIPSQLRDFLASYQKQQSTRRTLEQSSSLSANLLCPTDAVITSPFGSRTDPQTGEEAFHYGVDLGAAKGDKIVCAADGVVAEAGESEDYGHYLLISHADELYTLYAHCETVLFAAGESVQAGQLIATVGDSGRVTGPHLHFEVRKGDTWLDPAQLIDFKQDTQP
ncbi:MAG: M23 family metallopeptidase [Ruminococcaceae bacterium]|nr:M23 family metallopeptidase [Oscillospiraceae bacterium]